MTNLKTTFLSCFLLFSLALRAQEPTSSSGVLQEEYQLKVVKTSTEIKIDGVLDENVWQSDEIATNFWLKFPSGGSQTKRQSVVRAAYDDVYVYFSAINYDTSTYVIQTLKRDPPNYFGSDAFAIILDPVNKQTNGFFFAVNPYNVQSEDLLSVNSGGGEMNFSWDNKWLSATQRHETFWTVEVAIPLKTLRYEAGNKNWGVNFLRSDLKNNEYGTWTNIPVQFDGTDLGYTGKMIWDESPAKPGANVSIIPYVTGGVSLDRENNGDLQKMGNIGGDAKIALGSSLNLDLTFNPDFSQIEVDQQVTNLTRFNIFFPEKRTFFLENSDIFSNYGAPPFRPFYSRRIGIDNEGNTVPIIFGARLSGNLNDNLRIGAMNMQTAETNSQSGQNYTALSFSQRVLKRSSIKGYFLNKESMQKSENPLAMDNFGRNAGLEITYSNLSGAIQFWGGAHTSIKPGITEKNSFVRGGGRYIGKNLTFVADVAQFGDNYHADMGFINRIESSVSLGDNYGLGDSLIRQGFGMLYNEIQYTIRPEDRKVNILSFGIENFLAWLPNGNFSEYTGSVVVGLNFQNTSNFRAAFSPIKTVLQYYTPLPTEKPLAPGTYQYNQLQVTYRTDRRKKLFGRAGLTAGGFYNGNLKQYTASVGYRQQPWGNFSVDFELNDITFPEGYGNLSLFLVRPRVEVNFSNSLFWTTFIQYNTQANNFNINSRFQWRYKPMSDFFLVYTDNYFSQPFLQNKNRALVFKWNYWLTL